MVSKKKGVVDKNRLPESDPNMNRFFDIDTAKRKVRYWQFADKLKNIYPDAVPYFNLKSPELCDQCEARIWTRQIRIQKALIDYMIFVTCDICYDTCVEMCNQKGYRIHLLRYRPQGLG